MAFLEFKISLILKQGSKVILKNPFARFLAHDFFEVVIINNKGVMNESIPEILGKKPIYCCLEASHDLEKRLKVKFLHAYDATVG